MCNLHYIEIIKINNRQYWEQRKYLKNLEDFLIYLEKHFDNIVEDFYKNKQTDIHEHYIAYLEHTIEETKKRIKSNKYILRSYYLIAKPNTSLG